MSPDLASMRPRSSLARVLFSSALVSLCLLILALAACGTTGSGGSVPTPTTMPTTAPTLAPFTVASIDLSVSPTSIAGTTCGSSATFTYTATFHIPAGTSGGTIQYAYTLNNGRSQTPGSVTVGAGETSKSFTFVSSGTLPPDHTYPGVAIVMVTSPNNLISPSAMPSGACS